MLLAIACGGKPHPARRACVPLATGQLEEAAARDRNRQALLDAIRARGLELVTLPAIDAGRGGERHDWRSEGTRILAPVMERSCSDPLPEHGEFVKNAAGELWTLVPGPTAKSKRTIDVCACASQQNWRGCGAAPEPFQIGFELPAGLTFRGTMDLPYQVEDVWIAYADYREGSGCPKMPEPPP